jgi:hypothetical protein
MANQVVNKEYYIAIEHQYNDNEITYSDAIELSRMDITDMTQFISSKSIIKITNAIYRVVENYITKTPKLKDYFLSNLCTTLDELIHIDELIDDDTAHIVFSKISTFGNLLGLDIYVKTDKQLSTLEAALIQLAEKKIPHEFIRIPIKFKQLIVFIHNKRKSIPVYNSNFKIIFEPNNYFTLYDE